MTITTILTITLGIISIIFAFVLGRKSVTKKMKKKNKKAKKAKKIKKVKKERKPRKTWKAKAEDIAGYEEEYKKLTQNNELVPVTNTLKA